MSWLSKGLKTAERSISNVIPHAHSADRRANMAAAKEQLDFYKEQKETMHKASEDLAKEKNLEREKINAKQIRSLRRNFRRGSSGFMGSTPGNEVKDTLG